MSVGRLMVCVVVVVSSLACTSDSQTGSPDRTSTEAATTTTAPPAPANEDLAAAMRRLVSLDLTDKPPAATGEGAEGGMDMKGPHPSRPLANKALQVLYDGQIAEASAVAVRYPTLADAEANGYIITPLVEPGVGVHAVNWGLVGGFDPQRPAMLLYESLDPSSRIIALSYYILGEPDRQPEGFAGDNDHWHNHIDICIQAGTLLPTTHDPDECAASQGTYLTGRNLWMLHAWVVEGVTNPWGAFATYNPNFDADGGDDH